MRFLVPFVALAMTGCATASTTPPIGPDVTKFDNNDIVEFVIKSWGAPVEQWRIVPTGRGSFGERVSESYAPSEPYRIDWHEFDAGPAGYARLASAIDALPNPAPSYHDCVNRMTDAGYGTLRITRGAETREIAIYDGCFDPEYRRFLAQVKAISGTVEAWGEAQPVARSEAFNQR